MKNEDDNYKFEDEERQGNYEETNEKFFKTDMKWK